MKKLLKTLLIIAIFSTTLIYASSFSIMFNNDVFLDHDQFYTNGARFMYTEDNDDWFLVDANWWLFNDLFCNTNKSRSWAISLAQHMYTPSDISVPEFMPDDRPYGGWLYVGYTFMARDNKEMDTLEIDVGVTGPPSLSEQTQKWVHKVLGCQEPMGWDHQVKAYPGLDLVYEKRYRFRADDCFDYLPYYGGSLGNVFTYGQIGNMIRLGYNLPDDFGTWRMEPTLRACRGLFNDFSIYGFADISGRYVARNLLLEGERLDGPCTIEKRELIGEIDYGIGMNCGILEITYGVNNPTKEFYGQKDYNRYGGINLSINW